MTNMTNRLDESSASSSSSSSGDDSDRTRCWANYWRPRDGRAADPSCDVTSHVIYWLWDAIQARCRVTVSMRYTDSYFVPPYAPHLACPSLLTCSVTGSSTRPCWQDKKAADWPNDVISASHFVSGTWGNWRKFYRNNYAYTFWNE